MFNFQKRGLNEMMKDLFSFCASYLFMATIFFVIGCSMIAPILVAVVLLVLLFR